MVIVKIYYLYRVTLKLKVIALVHGCGLSVEPLHDFHFQGHGVTPQRLFIDFQIP